MAPSQPRGSKAYDKVENLNMTSDYTGNGNNAGFTGGNQQSPVGFVEDKFSHKENTAVEQFDLLNLGDTAEGVTKIRNANANVDMDLIGLTGANGVPNNHKEKNSNSNNNRFVGGANNPFQERAANTNPF